MLSNYIKTFSSLLLLLPLTALASDCAEKIGCDKKACEIENKITIAKANEHTHKLIGLNEALEQVNTYCTNDDLRDELQEKIEDSQEEIIEYRSELDEAVTYKEEDKIIKYQKKIEEEEREIKEFEKSVISTSIAIFNTLNALKNRSITGSVFLFYTLYDLNPNNPSIKQLNVLLSFQTARINIMKLIPRLKQPRIH